MSQHRGGPGRYASTLGGLDAFGTEIISRVLVTVTCGIAWLLGIPASRWLVLTTQHTTRDGRPFRYVATLEESFTHSFVNFFLLLFTLGLAGPWVFCRNERFRLAHTTTAEGHRMRFTGEGIEIFAIRWATPFFLLCTLGLAWPWITVFVQRWLHEHTMIEDPSSPRGEYALRFDASGASYFVELLGSVILTLLTFGIGLSWAHASHQRFVWSWTSDTRSPR